MAGSRGKHAAPLWSCARFALHACYPRRLSAPGCSTMESGPRQINLLDRAARRFKAALSGVRGSCPGRLAVIGQVTGPVPPGRHLEPVRRDGRPARRQGHRPCTPSTGRSSWQVPRHHRPAGPARPGRAPGPGQRPYAQDSRDPALAGDVSWIIGAPTRVEQVVIVTKGRDAGHAQERPASHLAADA